jgi:hypothetical protein
MLLELQIWPLGQVPQGTALPQLSVDMPQFCAPQLLLDGTQPQRPGPVVGQVFGAEQVPQTMVPPQPSLIEPQLFWPQA